MSAPSPMLSSLNQRLSAGSLQLLQTTGLVTAAQAPQIRNVGTIPPAAIGQADSEPISDAEKLEVFEAVLREAESTQSQLPAPAEPDMTGYFAGVPPQALPQATEDMWQQNQPAQQSAATGGKERAASAWSLDAAVQEAGGVLTTVEQEKQPEIPPEVESYLQRVADNQESPAKELAALIPKVASSSTPAPTEVVRVLPLTKTAADAGRRKGAKFSVRWLVEWSDKIVKMFRGKAAYQKPA